MEPIIFVNPDSTGHYYAFFYLLAFIAGFVLLMWEGKKRKYPTIPWMLVVITAFLFFIVGCRLVNFSAADWTYVFRLEPLPGRTGRTVLGGILFSALGILLAKKILRFQYRMVDAFALVLPSALMIQRFGCLMAGCCYGKPTSLPWAIQYGSNSHAFMRQVGEDLISADSKFALPVHPVQLYEVGCCLFIVVAIMLGRKLIKAHGNLFLVSIGLYGTARFFLEFVRGNHEGDPPFYFTDVQFAILLAMPLLFILICKREKAHCADRSTQAYQQNFFRTTFFLLTLSMLFIVVSFWLNKTEILALNIVFVSMFAVSGWLLFKWFTVPQYRLVSMALPALAFVLMSQTLPDSAKSKQRALSYSTISVGIIGGNTDLLYGDDYTDDCYDDGKRTVYTNDYKTVALGYSHTTQQDAKSITWGLNVAIVDHEEHTYSTRVANFPNEANQFSGIALSPYARFDYSKFGFGLGFHAGEFSAIVPVDENEFSSVKQHNIYPSFSIRAGDRASHYIEYKFADQFPSSFPALSHQLYVGFGTTRRDKIWRGGGIKIGTASNAGIFVSTATAIGETVILETFFGGLGGVFNPYDYSHSTIGALSLHVKFGAK